MKKIVFYLQMLAMVFFTMSGFLAALPAAQAIAPVTLSVVTPVPTYTSSTNPSFTFNSDMAVTSSGVYVGGSCGTWSGYVGGAGIASGDNTIVFDAPGLGEGTYSDCYIEADNGAGTTTLNVPEFTVDYTPPYLNATLGDGSSDYSLPSTCPSVACGRGDTYGDSLVFNEELDSASQTAVEDAITAGADVAPRTYVWSSNRVRIYATTSVTFPEDVHATITDLAGNASTSVKLINSASSYIQDLIDAADPGDTIVIPAGTYEENIEIDKPLTLLGDIGDDLVGPGEDAPVISAIDCTRVVNINVSGVTFRGFIVLNDTCSGSHANIGIAPGLTSTTVANNESYNGYTGISLTADAYGNLISKNKLHDNYEGIFINGSIGNTFSYNEIYDNEHNGFEIVGNKSAGGNSIDSNDIHDNDSNGINFGPDLNTEDGDIDVDSNTIESNGLAGILINSNTSGISITNNTIADNGQDESMTGIHVYSAAGNSAHNNIISNDNVDIGVNNEDSYMFDASYNYWGSANGPYEATRNPDGNVDSSIVGNVGFQPYYLDEEMTATSTVPSVVYVDDDYYDEGENDGHDWGVDAFDNIQDGVDAVLNGGTVNVLAGDYDSDSPIAIDKNGLQIIGPGIGDGVDRAIYQNTNCGRAFEVNASAVRIEGLQIEQRDGLEGPYCYNYPVIRIGNSSLGAADTIIAENDIAGGYIGIAVNYQSTDSTIEDNNIHDNDTYGIVIWRSSNTISGNEIHGNNWGIGMACGGDGCGSGQDLSGTVVSENLIYSNSAGGIRFYAGDQAEAVTIGPDNVITENAEGIYVYGDAYNLFINGNQIYGNTAPDSGLHIVNTTLLDATRNWWGDPAGPLVNEERTEETTDRELIRMEAEGEGNLEDMMLFFRPFCTDGDCEHLSSAEVTSDNLDTLFENGGSITPIFDGDMATSTAAVTSLNVNETTTIGVVVGAGTSTVTLPADTVITKTGGGTFDATDLTAADTAIGGLSGFASGKVVVGAFEWGLPSLGLTFNPAIAVNIYVGTEYNGQTLTIYRSNSQTSGWETSGIVAPGTCTVSEGVCSFQTTKASYFAATQGTGGGTSGGVLLSYQTALNNQTTTPAAYAYPITPNHNFIKVKGQSAVYWLSSENKRYLFANREVFSSWFGDDFSGLREISQSEFDGLAFGGNLTVKPGSYLKFDNNTVVYQVQNNYDIYPATGTPGKIYQIQASFENNYRLNGQLRQGIDLISTLLNNSFVQITGQPAVYWLSADNIRYLFANRDVFSSWFINNFAGLRQITQAEFDQLESGANLTIKPGSYLKFDNSDNLYKVVDSNNICKAASAVANFYKVQAGFEADYNMTGNCQ